MTAASIEITPRCSKEEDAITLSAAGDGYVQVADDFGVIGTYLGVDLIIALHTLVEQAPTPKQGVCRCAKPQIQTVPAIAKKRMMYRAIERIIGTADTTRVEPYTEACSKKGGLKCK